MVILLPAQSARATHGTAPAFEEYAPGFRHADRNSCSRVRQTMSFIDTNKGHCFGELLLRRSVHYGCRSYSLPMRGDYGESRRGVEGVAARAEQVGCAIRVIVELVTGNHTGAKRTKRALSATARQRMA